MNPSLCVECVGQPDAAWCPFVEGTRPCGQPPENRDGSPPPPPMPTWSPGDPPPPAGHRVVITSFLNSYSGAGRHIEYFGRSLESAGVEVGYEATGRDEVERPISEWLAGHVVRHPRDPWRLFVQYNGHKPPEGRAVVYGTMHETTRLPRGSAAKMNDCIGVIVPASWQVKAFRESGVKVPIKVVPLGFDPDEGYVPTSGRASKRTDGPFEVLFLGMLMSGGIRKGHGDAMRAFVKAFPPSHYPDARLTIKITARCRPLLGDVPDDPRIRIIDRYLPTPELIELMNQSSVLLAPTYGEGWGLHTLEAMALGLAPITCIASAAADFVSESFAYPLGYRWEDAQGFYSEQGQWHKPRLDSIVAQLRRAYLDRDELAHKGMKAIEASRNWTWGRAGFKLRDALISFGLLESQTPYYTAIARCPDRDKIGCGCTGISVCKRGNPEGGWREVSYAQCFECVKGAGPPQ